MLGIDRVGRLGRHMGVVEKRPRFLPWVRLFCNNLSRVLVLKGLEKTLHHFSEGLSSPCCIGFRGL
jgi:hypothetical protein